MIKRIKPIALWLGALLVVASALLYYEADVLWKVQQHNVFLDSALFFRQMMAVPGGLLSYVAAYFTQHFYYPWVGVVLMCGWWLLLMWLTQRTFRIPEKWKVVTLIPVAILLVINMDLGYWIYVIKLPGFFFVPTIGVTAVTALLWAYRCLPEQWWLRGTFMVTVTLVGYPLLGVYALAAVLLMGLLTWRRWLLAVVSLLSVVVIPLLCYRLVYHATNLMDIWRAAIPFFSVTEKYPEYYVPYYVLGVCFLLLTVTYGREWKAPKTAVGYWLLNAVCGLLVVGGVWQFWYKDANFHHELRMQRCVEQADWEGVVEEGTKQDGEPTRAIVMMHNLALSRLGRQCDEMYRFPKGSSKPQTPLPIYMYNVAGRMMLYQYGMMNECHRVCMEEGVEYGWNVEQLKYLARCAIFNKEQQAARKFLDILRQTAYYGQWADHMEQLLNDTQLLANDSETGPITHMMHHTDLLDSVDGYVEKSVMTALAQTDADDLYFQEQAVLGALWTRDPNLFWPRFNRYVQLNEDGDWPRIFQEAAWLFANMEGMQGLDEWVLAPGVKESLQGFMSLMSQYRKAPSNALRQSLYDHYGTTYYFEFFFLRDITYY